MGSPNNNSSISGEGGLEPLQDEVGEEVEEMMEESSCMSKVKEATGTEGSARAEESETHTEVIEAKGSWRTVEAKEPEGSSGDKDTSGRTGKGPTAGIRR